jgi:hypothetical protein
VTLDFKDGTDIYRARQLVTERLQSATDSIPAGLTPKLVPNTTGLGEVLYYSVDYAPGAPNAPPTRQAQLIAGAPDVEPVPPSVMCGPCANVYAKIGDRPVALLYLRDRRTMMAVDLG